MRFVDEAEITVAAGHGGAGCLSFHRTRQVPRGGPDGGDGGTGGSVYMEASAALSTLAIFRYKRLFRAAHGERGRSQQALGANGPALTVKTPLGTIVRDSSSSEILGDLAQPGQRLLVARGGRYGRGNTSFKSATNRSPRQTTAGGDGETRKLHLHLRLLADVGLFGAPNAGKSSLLNAVSAAQQRVADYPFTTLHPALAVIQDHDRRFVMADVPGLIAGAASGRGLGSHFLRQLSRTSLLLHIIDISLPERRQQAQQLHQELALFDPKLAQRACWLVCNKIDLYPAEEAQQRCRQLAQELNWKGPLFTISAQQRQGTAALCLAIMSHLEDVQSAAQK